MRLRNIEKKREEEVTSNETHSSLAFVYWTHIFLLFGIEYCWHNANKSHLIIIECNIYIYTAHDMYDKVYVRQHKSIDPPFDYIKQKINDVIELYVE